MIAVIGTFRLPPERVEEAMPLMREVIEQTLQEVGCQSYSYAQDVRDAGLFHVTEIWTDRAALDRHFDTAHMRSWATQREALGFHDRNIRAFSPGAVEEL